MPDYNYYPVSDATGKQAVTMLEKINSALMDIAHSGDKPVRYGYRVKQNESNPQTRVEYLFDAVGMAPAGLNSSDVFEYGSWRDAWFVKGNFPCMVTNGGAIAYKLNPMNHAQKEDGTASDVANTAYAGQAMSAIPTCWVKRYTEGGYRYFIVSNEPYDSTYKAYAHTRANGTISPYMFMPMYKGSMVDDKLRSLSGQRPQSGTTAAQEKTAAAANGDRWGLRTWMADELVYDLLVLIGKSTDVQSTFGQGYSTGGSNADSALTTGTMNTAGQFGGRRSSTTQQVKVFYMEGFYAERWEREEGMVFKDGVYLVKPTPEGDGYNFDGTGYTRVGALSPAENGYVKTFEQNDFGAFPSAVGGGSSTYECDYFYQNASGVRVPLRGGASDAGVSCGRYLYVNCAASTASWALGASLFLKNPS